MDLFSSSQGIAQKKNQTTPLAQRLRPTCFEDILGQDHLIGPEGILFQMVAQKNFHSFILWGPPGTGKTTIARVFAMECGLEFHSFSAVLSNLKEVKDQMLKAKEQHHITGKPTVIFMDEIHRFNKLQQDAFLPFVESGDLVLIGATTENPSFEIRNALLSRLRVYTVKELSSDNIVSVLDRALKDDQVLIKKNIRLEDKAKNYIAQQSMGDARAALTLLEYCSSSSPQNAVIDQTKVSKVLQKNPLYYDQHGDQHYDIISALHKSLRNSDENAALYWMARMLEGGEDPLYVVRRLIRFASEDVGLADPHALVLAIACQQTVHFLGMPEGKLALAQLTVYLAQAPKSNAIYRA
ncbi:MAG: replication-associated recombination protein A, partial [Bdellovibrionota bacterium]